MLRGVVLSALENVKNTVFDLFNVKLLFENHSITFFRERSALWIVASHVSPDKIKQYHLRMSTNFQIYLFYLNQPHI